MSQQGESADVAWPVILFQGPLASVIDELSTLVNGFEPFEAQEADLFVDAKCHVLEAQLSAPQEDDTSRFVDLRVTSLPLDDFSRLARPELRRSLGMHRLRRRRLSDWIETASPEQLVAGILVLRA